jgi:hypothetical protein
VSVLLDTTVGGPSTNSYQTLVEANAYAAPHLNAAQWSALGSSGKILMMVRAVRIIDAQFPWMGRPVTDTQILQFPRFDIYHPSGIAYSLTEIPACVKQAQGELQCWMAGNGLATDKLLPGDEQALQRLKAGPVELEWRADSTSAAEQFLYGRIADILRRGNVLGSSQPRLI